MLKLVLGLVVCASLVPARTESEGAADPDAFYYNYDYDYDYDVFEETVYVALPVGPWMDQSYNNNYDYNQRPQPQSRNNQDLVSYYINGVFHGKGPSLAYEIQTLSEPTDYGSSPLNGYPNGNIFADGILPQFALVIKEEPHGSDKSNLPSRDSPNEQDSDLLVNDEKSKPFDVEKTQAESYNGPTQKPRQRTEMLGVPAVPNAPDNNCNTNCTEVSNTNSYDNNSSDNDNTTTDTKK